MMQEEAYTFCAWLDEERRIVSFHEIPDARRFDAGEDVFWEAVVALVLAGYRVQ